MRSMYTQVVSGRRLRIVSNEKLKEKEFKATFEDQDKKPYGKLPVAFCMMREILTESQTDAR